MAHTIITGAAGEVFYASMTILVIMLHVTPCDQAAYQQAETVISHIAHLHDRLFIGTTHIPWCEIMVLSNLVQYRLHNRRVPALHNDDTGLLPL